MLYDYAVKGDADELFELVVVRTQQHQFSEVVEDYLERIHYAGDGWASSVHLPTYGTAEVVVDPKVAFGLPLVAHGEPGSRISSICSRPGTASRKSPTTSAFPPRKSKT